MLSLEDRDLPDRADPHAELAAARGRRSGSGTELAPAAAAAARGVPAAGAGGQRLRGDRRGARHHAGRGPGTLPSRGEAIEGAGPMTACTRLSDRMPEVAHGRRAGRRRGGASRGLCRLPRASGSSCTATAASAQALRRLADPEATSDRRARAAARDGAAHPARGRTLDGGRAGRRGRRAAHGLDRWAGATPVGGVAPDPPGRRPSQARAGVSTAESLGAGRTAARRSAPSFRSRSSTTCRRRLDSHAAADGRARPPGRRLEPPAWATWKTPSWSRCSPDLEG